MDIFDVFVKLKNNSKLKAKSSNSVGNMYFDGNSMRWEITGRIVVASSTMDETWEIIEPERKLKEMCYGEAAFLYWGSRKNNLDNLISAEDIKSVVTGKHADRTFDKFTREEFLGKWTIEGIYEDDEGGNEE